MSTSNTTVTLFVILTALIALVDASLGYRFEKFTIAMLGSNLGDRRDAVQLSELGEGQF